jgi:hypothetical protein
MFPASAGVEVPSVLSVCMFTTNGFAKPETTGGTDAKEAEGGESSHLIVRTMYNWELATKMALTPRLCSSTFVTCKTLQMDKVEPLSFSLMF